jgi:hypothetical protein
MTSMSIAFSVFNLYARRLGPTMVPLDWLAFLTGLMRWPLATLASFVSLGVALALYAFIVLFYVAMPILRENRGPAAGSAQTRSNPVALGGARTAEPGSGDLGQDP